MKNRWRKPAAEKSAVVVAGRFGHRPDPPPELNARQRDIWRGIVSSEDPNFFNTEALRALLADYCRRRETSENISGVINSSKPDLKSSDGLRRFKQLLALRDLEVRGAGWLATKLRLTNQSRYNALSAATAANRAPKGPRPWE